MAFRRQVRPASATRAPVLQALLEKHTGLGRSPAVLPDIFITTNKNVHGANGRFHTRARPWFPSVDEAGAVPQGSSNFRGLIQNFPPFLPVRCINTHRDPMPSVANYGGLCALLGNGESHSELTRTPPQCGIQTRYSSQMALVGLVRVILPYSHPKRPVSCPLDGSGRG
jgi:hypothetical protein